MSISIGTDYLNTLTNSAATAKKTSSADKLNNRLNNLEGASDEEMLEACKEFEAYFVEKIIEMMHKSAKLGDEEEENEYIQQFGSMQYEQYAKNIAESGQLGLAQQLYEAMKRN